MAGNRIKRPSKLKDPNRAVNVEEKLHLLNMKALRQLVLYLDDFYVQGVFSKWTSSGRVFDRSGRPAGCRDSVQRRAPQAQTNVGGAAAGHVSSRSD